MNTESNKTYRYLISYALAGRRGRCGVDRQEPISSMEDIYDIEKTLGESWHQEVVILNWRRFEDPE